MPTLLYIRAAMLVVAFAMSAPWAVADPACRCQWTGSIEFRGDRWPVRLFLPADPSGATIDLPALWMAWEPLKATVDGGGTTVELPFGLGAIALSHCDEGLCGSRAIGADTLELSLRRDGPLQATRVPVQLRSGVATLRGEFLAPPGEALPAVVIVHGAGNNDRGNWDYRSAADFWLRHGFAVLLYDKRGSGESDGDWMTTSFPDLADLGADLRAMLDWVARQPGVDPGRVGVHGGSQALWTVAIASQLGDAPAFAVLSGAPATTPLEQERDSVLRTLAGAGLEAPDLAAARAHVDLYFRAAADPAHSGAAIASSTAASGTAWGELVPTAATDDDFYWWRRNHGYDPSAALRGWNSPVLLLYGEADTVAAPALHAPRMRLLLEPDALEIATFPGAVHNLELPMGRDADGQWRFPRRHPGVAATIEAWLDANGLSLRPQPQSTPAMTDILPDRLSTDPRSPFYDEALLERGIGIRFNGEERTNIEEYCISEGWVRVAVGKALDRRGHPMTMKIRGKVEPFLKLPDADTAADA